MHSFVFMNCLEVGTPQILAGVVNPTSGNVFVEKPKNFVFQIPDHQKQRVAIAGALAEASKVLLLDELTTFLDESDQLDVIKVVKCLIKAKNGGDVTALWVTHQLEELEYAGGAVYMENGRVVRHGDVATISDFIKAKQSTYFDQIGS